MLKDFSLLPNTISETDVRAAYKQLRAANPPPRDSASRELPQQYDGVTRREYDELLLRLSRIYAERSDSLKGALPQKKLFELLRVFSVGNLQQMRAMFTRFKSTDNPPKGAGAGEGGRPSALSGAPLEARKREAAARKLQAIQKGRAVRETAPQAIAKAHRRPKAIELTVHTVRLSAATLAADPTLRTVSVGARLANAKETAEASDASHAVRHAPRATPNGRRQTPRLPPQARSPTLPPPSQAEARSPPLVTRRCATPRAPTAAARCPSRSSGPSPTASVRSRPRSRPCARPCTSRRPTRHSPSSTPRRASSRLRCAKPSRSLTATARGCWRSASSRRPSSSSASIRPPRRPRSSCASLATPPTASSTSASSTRWCSSCTFAARRWLSARRSASSQTCRCASCSLRAARARASRRPPSSRTRSSTSRAASTTCARTCFFSTQSTEARWARPR